MCRGYIRHVVSQKASLLVISWGPREQKYVVSVLFTPIMQKAFLLLWMCHFGLGSTLPVGLIGRGFCLCFLKRPPRPSIPCWKLQLLDRVNPSGSNATWIGRNVQDLSEGGQYLSFTKLIFSLPFFSVQENLQEKTTLFSNNTNSTIRMYSFLPLGAGDLNSLIAG